MADNIKKQANSLSDLEVESPSSVDSSLPSAALGIHNLCMQGGMAIIAREKAQGFLHPALDFERSLLVASFELR